MGERGREEQVKEGEKGRNELKDGKARKGREGIGKMKCVEESARKKVIK